MNSYELLMKRRVELVGTGLALIALAAFCMCIMFGCGARVKHVTNLPPGVTESQVQAWDSEVAALHKMAVVTSSVRQGIIGLEQSGAFPDTVAYVNALQAVRNIDQLELNASAYLRKEPQTFGVPQKQHIQILLNAIAGEIQALNQQGITRIKNPDTAKEVNALVVELVSGLNLALSFTQ